MEPFTVRLQSKAHTWRGRGLWSLEEELKIPLLLQARDNYTTFTGRFNLSLEPSAFEINVEESTRNTLVIIEEMGTTTYVDVRVACGALNTTAFWGHALFFLIQFCVMFLSPVQGHF